MRDLSVNEQQSVAGGIALSSQARSSVLLALREGNFNTGVGTISLPMGAPGVSSGPLIVSSPVFFGGPGGLPYDC